ncbi:MAG: sigma-70 family RNA polymerase sigma factor [Chloroflexales bacterium]|nr:sigma-70 family RNA polymerase sigma factor [Chloroflexales bacterium]
MWLRRRRTIPIPQNLNAWQRDPVATALDNELHAQLESALTKLSENLRVIFVLRELYGLSAEETAMALELGESAVKVRLHQARLRLRELLANYMTKPVGDAYA